MSLNTVAAVQRQYALTHPYNRAHGYDALKNFQHRLHSGLTVTLIISDRENPPRWQLSAMRDDTGPTLAEQRQCRESYHVPPGATERHVQQPPDVSQPLYTFVVYSWPLSADEIQQHERFRAARAASTSARPIRAYRAPFARAERGDSHGEAAKGKES